MEIQGSHYARNIFEVVLVVVAKAAAVPRHIIYIFCFSITIIFIVTDTTSPGAI